MLDEDGALDRVLRTATDVATAVTGATLRMEALPFPGPEGLPLIPLGPGRESMAMSQVQTALRCLVSAAVAAGSLHANAGAQSPVWVREEGTFSVPIDLEFTSSGARVVVRGVDSSAPESVADAITVWDAQSGTILARTTSPPGPFCGNASIAVPPPQSSDTVRVVGNMAVLIADGVGSAQTLIDVVDAGANPPVCLANWALPPTPTGGVGFVAGGTHDIEITPDGNFAVVNCNNWIFIVNLTTAPPTLCTGLNTGGPLLPSWASPPQNYPASGPGPSVDSVAVTNERGIVVQAAIDNTNGNLYPIVYLLDFATQDPLCPSVTQIDMRPYLSSTPGNFDPHDVAISPTFEDLAVCTWQKAVSLFDLVTLAHVNSLVDTGVTRVWGEQVDSLEIADDHAVVIGRKNGGTSIKVFSLRSGVPPVPLLVEKPIGNNPNGFESGDSMPPHDLALQPPLTEDTDLVAVVRSGRAYISDDSTGKIWVLGDVTASQVPAPVSISSAATPYPFGLQSNHRVSDSIETLTVRVGTEMRMFGVAIGTKLPGGPVFQAGHAAINVFSLDGGAPFQQEFFVFDPNPPHLYGTVPFDLTVARNGKRAFVRCWAFPDEAWNPTSPPPGRDVLAIRFDTSPQPILEAGWSIGGQGVVDNINMADLIAVKGSRVVSITKDASTNQLGFVHTVSNP